MPDTLPVTDMKHIFLFHCSERFIIICSTICSSKQVDDDFPQQGSGHQVSLDPTDAILHRDHALSDFSTDLSRIQIRSMQDYPQGQYEEDETFFHDSDGRGVENGVNDNTYF